MSNHTEIQALGQMVQASTSPYHSILEASRQLHQEGFEELSLSSSWTLKKGGAYYVNVFDSTLIGFTVGEELSEVPSLLLAASHTDWLCLKLKPSPEVTSGKYGRLNVEVYGGPILNTWMDRPLSLAGKVCCVGQDPLHPKTILVDAKRPLLTIPNLPIHVNREVNKGVAYNPQIDMLPLCTLLEEEMNRDSYLLRLLAGEANVAMEDILDYEIYVYNFESPTKLGIMDEFYSSPRLDNLTSVQACLRGILLNKNHAQDIHVIALYDNEEVGSSTKQGAASAVMERVLEKIYLSLDYSRQDFLNGLLGGFFLSMDVAHALHPNRSEKYDIKNHVYTGDGIAIKLAASQAYATDASASSVIEALCRQEKIPYKKFSNRSDIKGGSTLGSISSCLLTMRTVDVGVPLLAMHSARETMCCSDQAALVKLVSSYFRVLNFTSKIR